jgi:hypothetical protein
MQRCLLLQLACWSAVDLLCVCDAWMEPILLLLVLLLLLQMSL